MSRYNKNRESNVDAQGFRVATGKSSSRGGRGRGGARGGGRPPATMNSRFAAFAMEQQQQMDGSGSEYHVRGETAGSSGQVFTERVQIPYGSAAYVIGKSGANVKRMMQMGAKCSVKDTVVHIQSSSRSQCQAAKKMVFDLLKSYNSRKQTQVNTLNLLAVGESVGALDNVLSAPKKHVPKVDLQEREGPLNSFEKIGEERTYFELKWDINNPKVVEVLSALQEGDEEDEEVDEEEAMIRALAQMRTGVNFKDTEGGSGSSSSSSSSTRESGKYTWSSDDAGLVQRFELVNDSLIKEKSLQNMAHKLHESKQRQIGQFNYGQRIAAQGGNAPMRKISFHTEVVIGHKLFFLNEKPAPGRVIEVEETTKVPAVPRAEKQTLPFNLQHQHIGDLLKLKIGYNQQLNSMFNSALTEDEMNNLKQKISQSPDFELVEKHVVLFIQVNQVVVDHNNRYRRRKYDLQCIVQLPQDGNDAEDLLLPITVNRTSDKNFKLMVVDVVRTQSKFDYRIRAKTFQTDMIFNEDAVQFIEGQLLYDAKNHALVKKGEETQIEQQEEDEEESAPWNYRMEYRRRYEDIYSDGKVKVVFRRKEEEETRFNELKNRSDKYPSGRQQQNDDDDDHHDDDDAHEEQRAANEDVEEDVNEEEDGMDEEEDRRRMVILEVTVFSEEVDKYGDASNVVFIKEKSEHFVEGAEMEHQQQQQQEEEETADPELVKLQQTTEKDVAQMLNKLADFLHNELLN